ncbi:MAG: 4Fe-4S ferredoxin [Desulfobacterales bacterium]|nr:4Fe-4S ferredoxin [Desulfobacterales bacterium]
MKVLRKIIRIDEELCDGCGQCVPGCAEAALEIVNGKATLMAEKYCDGLGACLGECPTGALTLVEREVDDFDEQAVEELLQSKKQEAAAGEEGNPGCPSARMQTFTPVTPCDIANQPLFTTPSGSGSALNHWPVQIRLVPPTAPFLKGADLLVAADCVPVAHADFHAGFLSGRAVMIGCPKFDDPNGYVDKFTEVFKTAGIKTINLVIMEVPCCGGMKEIVREARKRSGRDIPVRETVISTRGGILRQENW